MESISATRLYMLMVVDLMATQKIDQAVIVEDTMLMAA